MEKELKCPTCKCTLCKITEISLTKRYKTEIACRNCKRLIVYNPCTDKIKQKRIPKPLSSSGRRFY